MVDCDTHNLISSSIFSKVIFAFLNNLKDIPFASFTIAYNKTYQVQTYTVNESILTDNEAKTELLKDYCVVKYSDTPDGQICLIKIKDVKRWR